jgi:hypothetical protein
MLTGAAVLVAVTAIGGVVAISDAEQATPAAQHPPVNTATVGRGRLSDMVSQYGTLTYRAGSDGSPYTVINRARGTFTKLEGEPGSNLDPDSPRFLAADDACKSLLPAMAPVDEQEVRDAMLAFARYMREHGFPNFPDPKPGEEISIDAGEHPELDIEQPEVPTGQRGLRRPGRGRNGHADQRGCVVMAPTLGGRRTCGEHSRKGGSTTCGETDRLC